ncbi:MAG: tetratricopeptide repeat protein, partial [Bacteroidales bacterium]|nr:tetratricopeptide repeat protein [Bacteroidales bacterium]
MKHILTLLSAIVLTFLSGDVYAQKNKTDNDYNLKKAYEVLEEEHDEAKALDLVSKQLRETPDNVDALLLRVRLLQRKGEYGPALTDVNRAIKVNKPKKSEIVNSTLYWWKGMVYQGLRDYESSAAALRTAYELVQKDNPEYKQSVAFDYAQVLLRLEDDGGAETVYRQMLADDEADQGAMAGLACVMTRRGNYEDAVKLLDKCQKFDPDYSETYHFKMVAYDKLGEAAKAIDAGLMWFEKDDDVDPEDILEVLKKRSNYAEAGIKSMIRKSENTARWKYFLCHFYQDAGRYAEAVRSFDEMEAEFGKYAGINFYRSQCYSELGLNEQAIADISKIMEDDADWQLYCERGDFFRLSGDLDRAIEEFSAAVEDDPRQCYPYYKRGWCYEMKGDPDRALEDYNLGIEMDDDYPYLFLMRGELNLTRGDRDAAAKDFETVLQLDTVVRSGSCRHYALHFLGRDDEAEAWMKQIIALNPADHGELYDLSCLYARMGRLDDSVSALRSAFENGYRDFSHLGYDDDMDPVRDLPEYQALVAEYKAKHDAFLKEFLADAPVSGEQETVTEIAVKRNPGGTFEIPCDINGLSLRMIFDTGASDVTISSVEANFMLKNGYLSEKDIKGKNYYQTADGEISVGTVVVLREVKIGDA